MPTQIVTENHLSAIASSNTYEELRDVMLQMAQELHTRANGNVIHLVCGSISTGGTGNRAKNLEVFNNTITHFSQKGLWLFSQIPFEDKMGEIHGRRAKTGIWPTDVYDYPLLEIFYRALFETRIIGKKLFLANWKTSTGAEWERAEAIRLGTPYADLNEHLEIVAEY